MLFYKILNDYCTTGYNKHTDFMRFLKSNKIYDEITYNQLKEKQEAIYKKYAESTGIPMENLMAMVREAKAKKLQEADDTSEEKKAKDLKIAALKADIAASNKQIQDLNQEALMQLQNFLLMKLQKIIESLIIYFVVQEFFLITSHLCEERSL